MPEKEPQHTHSEDVPCLVEVTDIQVGVDSQGEESLAVDIATNCEVAQKVFEEDLSEAIGSEPDEIVRIKPSESSSDFGFSSRRWNSPWNPTGPKKNWGPPPNPELN